MLDSAMLPKRHLTLLTSLPKVLFITWMSFTGYPRKLPPASLPMFSTVLPPAAYLSRLIEEAKPEGLTYQHAP